MKKLNPGRRFEGMKKLNPYQFESMKELNLGF
jgi:hypothetical protein